MRFTNLFARFKEHFFASMSHSSRKVNVAQILYFSVICGVFGSLLSSAYFFLLEFFVTVVWKWLFEALKNAGVFSSSFPEYNFIWMGSLPFILIICLLLKLLGKRSPAGFGLSVDKIHTEGKIPPETFFPMLLLSLFGLSSASGVGPEAPILGLSGAAISFLGEKLKLPKRPLRVFVLTGVSAALASFFGSPLTGLFGLEFSHRLGIEYFEALIPSTVASFIGTSILQAIFQRPFGAFFSFTFSTHLDVFTPVEMLLGAALGLVGACIGLLFTMETRALVWLTAKLNSARFKYFLPLVAWAVYSVAGMFLPAILFWGEPDLQNVLDANASPLYHWRGNSSGIVELGTAEGGLYPPHVVFFIALVKLLILPFNLAMEIKGGIVFPLFFIGGTMGQLIHMVIGIDHALAVCCVMAAAQASVTRTPFASTFVAVFNVTGPNSQIMIPVLVASFVSVLVTLPVPTFPSQREREDLVYAVEHKSHAAVLESPAFRANEGAEADGNATETLLNDTTATENESLLLSESEKVLSS